MNPTVEDLNQNFFKISNIFTSKGYNLPIFSLATENFSQISDLNQWTTIICESFLDSTRRIDDLTGNLLKLSEKILKVENDRESLFDKIQTLQDRNFALEQNEKSLHMQIDNLKRETTVLKPVEKPELKAVKNLLKESENRNRKLEKEFHRLQRQLQKYVAEERKLPKVVPRIDFDSSKLNLSKEEDPVDSVEAITISEPSFEEISEMRDQIEDYKKKYESVTEMLERAETRSNDELRKIEILLEKLSVVDNERKDLQAELELRPSSAEWKMAQQKIYYLEEKIKQALQYRNDQIEILQWRKYLPTTEQINMDKKNHELQLWMIETLPDSVMKEVIQAICRELDLQDYTEILPSIRKLKSVVLTVPRMENFISSIGAFVSQRNSHLCCLLNQRDVDSYDTAGSVLTALRKWWSIIVRCTELERFYEIVLFELFRSEEYLKYPDNYFQNSAEHITVRWEERSRNDWKRKDFTEIQRRIRDLGESQNDQFKDATILGQVNERVRNRSDVLVFRILNHIEYLFGINRVEDILPTVNSFYVDYEEVNNFMKLLKAEVGKDANVSNAVVFTEVLRRLK